MNRTYTIFNVADWFLTQSKMTPKKLQKMCYYAYSWGLVFFNETEDSLQNKLFQEKLEAWVHGPVSPKLYGKYAKYGYGTIEKLTESKIEFEPDVLNLLKQVYDVYGSYDGNELESITHQESPWLNAREGFGPIDRCNVVLDDKEIFNYYGKQTA